MNRRKCLKDCGLQNGAQQEGLVGKPNTRRRESPSRHAESARNGFLAARERYRWAARPFGLVDEAAFPKLCCWKEAKKCDFPPYHTSLRLLLKGRAPKPDAHRGLSKDPKRRGTSAEPLCFTADSAPLAAVNWERKNALWATEIIREGIEDDALSGYCIEDT